MNRASLSSGAIFKQLKICVLGVPKRRGETEGQENLQRNNGYNFFKCDENYKFRSKKLNKL